LRGIRPRRVSDHAGRTCSSRRVGLFIEDAGRARRFTQDFGNERPKL
jgi:hypothetical protein